MTGTDAWKVVEWGLFTVLLGLGIRQLSVNPRAVPLVKRIIRGVSSSFAREAATAALGSRTADESRRELEFRLRAAFGNVSFLRDVGG